jgi:O-antigen/teichoic acid export membrane protein
MKVPASAPVPALTEGDPALPAGAPDTSGLDGELVSGLAWTGGVKWAAQGITWASTLIVARLLSPDDYGLLSLASVFMGIVTLLSEFGLGASVVMLRELDDHQIAQINGFAIIMGFGSFLLALAAAYPLGLFFRAPQLPAVVVAMSVVFIITSFRIVPGALLQRELRFKDLALNDGLKALLLSAAMVLFASLGFRYWTLVLGALLSSTLTTGLILRLRRHPIAWPRLGSIRRATSFSTDVVLSRIAWYFYSNSDFLVAGRTLGKGALGAYSLAWTIASVPVEKVAALVVGVTPGVFSAVQNDLAALRRYLVSLTEGIALVTFPAAVGLALVADDFVHVALTSKYEGAITPLRLLALYAMLRSIAPLLTPVLNAIGETRFAMWNNVLAFFLLPAGFLIGSRWGTTGIALTWIVVHPLIVAMAAWRVFSRIQLPVRQYVRSLAPGLAGVAAILLAWIALRWMLPDDVSRLLRLVLEVCGGALAYGAVTFGLFRHRLQAFRQVIRNAASRRTSDRTVAGQQ